MPALTSRSSRSRLRRRDVVVVGLVVAATVVGCGGDESSSPSDQAPTVVASTSIWADVVEHTACEGQLDVQTLIPAGSDPHAFEPSLADRGVMEGATMIVANGLGLEEGVDDTLDAVQEAGTPVFRVAEHVETIPYSTNAPHHDHENGEHISGDDPHEDGEHISGDDPHENGEHISGDDPHEDGEHTSGDDPHVWFDPVLVASVLPELADELIQHAGLDRAAIEDCVADYQATLVDLDAEIARSVSTLPADSRELVTSHDALGYFAHRYGFEVIGTIIPASSGLAQTSPAQLEALAQLIESNAVSAIFAETQHSTQEADALADRLGGVEVVTLTTGTLGDAQTGTDTYVGLLRVNADRIVAGLG